STGVASASFIAGFPAAGVRGTPVASWAKHDSLAQKIAAINSSPFRIPVLQIRATFAPVSIATQQARHLKLSRHPCCSVHANPRVRLHLPGWQLARDAPSNSVRARPLAFS